MTDESKFTFDQEIRIHAMNLAVALRKPDVRLTAGNGPDGFAETVVRDGAVIAGYLETGAVPPSVSADRPAQCEAVMYDGRRCHENDGHDGNHARFNAGGAVMSAWIRDGAPVVGSQESTGATA